MRLVARQLTRLSTQLNFHVKLLDAAYLKLFRRAATCTRRYYMIYYMIVKLSGFASDLSTLVKSIATPTGCFGTSGTNLEKNLRYTHE